MNSSFLVSFSAHLLKQKFKINENIFVNARILFAKSSKEFIKFEYFLFNYLMLFVQTIFLKNIIIFQNLLFTTECGCVRIRVVN